MTVGLPMASWHADFSLADWEVSPKLNRISKHGDSVSIKHKSMAVLVLLADADGEVLTRDEIMDGVWPGMEVTDDVLTQAVHELRHAFDDDAKNPHVIETIPRVGIRLIPVVTDAEKKSQAGKTESVASRRRRYLLGAFAIIFAGSLLWAVLDQQTTDRNPVIKVRESTSVAVLPFINRSDIAGDAYFVDGMPDDLRTLLSKLSSVDSVISRTSTERYRGTTKPIPQIGRELGVVAILEGAVQRSGNQVRINVRLIDAETERDLWAETYDRTPTAENLFGMQSEITREIVAALHGVLTEQENDALQTMPTDSLDAYAEFVLGRQQLAERTGEAIWQAEAHFEKAIALDGDYALAWIGLADTYMLMPGYQGKRFEDIAAPTQAAIDRALSIDPLLGEAYTSLAGLRDGQGQLEDAEQYYLRSIELSPGYARAYHWYHTLLRNSGRDEEALVQLLRALELDPLASVLANNLATLYLRLERYQDAETTLLDGIRRDPDFARFYRTGVDLLRGTGRVGEALHWAEIAAELDPSNPWYNEWSCDMYLNLGIDESIASCYAATVNAAPELHYRQTSWIHYSRQEFDEALEILRQWERETPGNDIGSLYYIAMLYATCGDPGSARSILEELDPHLFGEGDIDIAPHEILPTITAAYSMYVDSETVRANYLFDKALDVLRSPPSRRLRDDSDESAIPVIAIHAVRGNQELAVLALRDAIDRGWRGSWWQLRSPLYAAMQGNPEWLELMAELEADMQRQRKWFEEHKNQPLF